MHYSNYNRNCFYTIIISFLLFLVQFRAMGVYSDLKPYLGFMEVIIKVRYVSTLLELSAVNRSRFLL